MTTVTPVPTLAANVAPVGNITPAANANNVVNIADDNVPLAVNNTEDEVTNIEDEATPLAANAKQDEKVKTWWGWIVAAVAAVAGKGVYDHERRKPAKNNKDDSKKQK